VLLSAIPLAIGVWVVLPPARLAEAGATLLALRSWLRATTGLYADPAPAVDTATLPPAPLPVAPPPPSASGGTMLAYGDQLKVTFYETFGVTLAAPGGTAHQVATIYPRMDLSGDYTVDADGLLTLPRIGAFDATSQPTAQLQSAIQAAFQRVFGRPADVQIAITARQPVYVLGTVRNAGAIPYRPGMTVLQALAAAGGRAGAGATDASAAIETIRERQRLRQAETDAARLLITQLRLAALRADASTLTVPAATLARLNALVSPAEIATLLAGARAMLAMERSSFSQQTALAERQIAVARAGLAAQKLRVDQLADLIDKKNLRLRELQNIAARGSVAQFKLTELSAEIAEVVVRREDAGASVVQAERQVLEAEIVLARIREQHSTGIDQQASAVQQQIDDAGPNLAAMRAVIQALAPAVQPPATSAPAAHLAAGPANPSGFSITRRGAAGPGVIRADAATTLRPGDVVEVAPASQGGSSGRPAATGFTLLQN
jgi:protein involved in polysaccharide export with SLBB domain